MARQHNERGRQLRRYGYGAPIAEFLRSSGDEVIGSLTQASAFSVDQSQVLAWKVSIDVLQRVLSGMSDLGHVFLEYDIPRLGRRVDAIVIVDRVVFVVEFKVGASSFLSGMSTKSWTTHSTSSTSMSRASLAIVPVLVATDAPVEDRPIATSPAADGLFLTRSVVTASARASPHAHALALADGPPIDPLPGLRGDIVQPPRSSRLRLPCMPAMGG